MLGATLTTNHTVSDFFGALTPSFCHTVGFFPATVTFGSVAVVFCIPSSLYFFIEFHHCSLRISAGASFRIVVQTSTYKILTLLLESLSYPYLASAYIPYPIIHPTVLCITSSTSEKPFINQNCFASIGRRVNFYIFLQISHDTLALKFTKCVAGSFVAILIQIEQQ